MKIAVFFLLTVGCLWAAVTVWTFLSIAGMAGAPESWLKTVFYWSGMLVGPLILIMGAVMLLRGISLRHGAILAELGCVILTILVLYNSIVGMQHKPLQAAPPYSIYLLLLLVAAICDAAAYSIYRDISRLQ